MNLIDGNIIAKQIVTDLKNEVSKLKRTKPCVAFIRVGNDPASKSYVNKKQKTAEEIASKVN